jgi:hypothetical protein
MAVLQAGVPARPMGSTIAAAEAIGRGCRLVAARQIRHTAALIRRCRYRLYRIADAVMLVAGSWAG